MRRKSGNAVHLVGAVDYGFAAIPQAISGVGGDVARANT
jgi:hypothetical protein